MMYYEQLEDKFCEFTGKKYAVAVNSGTSGLHLALEAIGVKDKEVIIPDFTMAACAFAVSYAGGKVKTVDCGDDYNMRSDLVEITPDTAAIMPVHIYGREAHTDYPIPTVVDMSEAHGIKCTGDIAVYSLYRNKIVATEEGGIVVTDNKEYADNIRDLKNMAFGDKHNFYHERVGYNYRMSELQAELALKSLSKVKENLERRAEVNDWYNKLLSHNSNHQVDWVHDFLLKDNSVVDKVPEARYFFKPISSFPMYKQPTGEKAKQISEQGMYLPISPEMTFIQVQEIVDRLYRWEL